MAGAVFTMTVAAEPLLHLPGQKVSQRTTPAPFAVAEYHGVLQQGYQRLGFIAPGGELRWQAWTEPRYIDVARAAMALVERRALPSESCNRFFAERMPGGRTLSELWHATGSSRIRISFSPGPSGVWRAATYASSAPFEWTITETTVLLGPESVASAMVHEATRSNGVASEYGLAYDAERVCGMAHFLLTEPLIRRFGWRVVKHR